jgi:hypothetical protein
MQYYRSLIFREPFITRVLRCTDQALNEMEAKLKWCESRHPQISGNLCWKKIVLFVMDFNGYSWVSIIHKWFYVKSTLAKLKGCQMRSTTKNANLKGCQIKDIYSMLIRWQVLLRTATIDSCWYLAHFLLKCQEYTKLQWRLCMLQIEKYQQLIV